MNISDVMAQVVGENNESSCPKTVAIIGNNAEQNLSAIGAVVCELAEADAPDRTYSALYGLTPGSDSEPSYICYFRNDDSSRTVYFPFNKLLFIKHIPDIFSVFK